ncbi:MAM and LDL-receptor class A domain-containing protein 1 precursor [Xenopus tropicalis]|uniref:Diet1 n=1 Tax=Xenopus tropicalis TaxID=8364 RepID=R9W9S2_XENTR|nr:MAM and LDL-receptor class A domain-containing protein 1 precursor [Xenopus tropicalis]AGN95664.1 Diet1 [Xenopus tropicalis]|eukprot:NP_001297043.1 MAM and LDL-receptor class A domain-containing protein 1 precursor [Xenopus tropicalis]
MLNVCALFLPLVVNNLIAFVQPNELNGFRCSEGSFVPLDNLCDFADQCGDNSDERLCLSYERCDFERDLCGMICDGWHRTNGPANMDPSYDHRANETAQFLAFSSHKDPSDHAVLRSKEFLPTQERAPCQLRFFYFISDLNGTLSVGLERKSQDSITDIWIQESSEENMWRRAVITISSSEKFKVVIQAKAFGKDIASKTIAIDDISFNEGCSSVVDSFPSCDFDESLCGWNVRASAEHVPWTWRRGGTSVSQETGRFIFVEGSNNTLNRSAFLESSVSRISGRSCQFQFSYMTEEDNGFRLLLYSDGKEETLFETWESTQGIWVVQKVSLPGNIKELQLAFEGIIQSQRGSIALDDVRLISCMDLPLMGSNSPEAPSVAGTLCNSAINCDGSAEDSACCRNFSRCDFESGFCDWKPLSADGWTWHITMGRDTKDETLPNKDHTTKSEHGHFLYFSAPSKQENKSSSQLESSFFVKPLSMAAACKIQFWYQLRHTSKLSIFRRPLGYAALQLVGEISGPSTSNWTKATIYVSNCAEETMDPARIILAASLLSPNATVAIDDICLSPECVTASNFTPAAKCDFETDNCGWYEKHNSDSFEWMRQSRINVPPQYEQQAPPRDHTTNKSEGHFMFILKKKSTFSQIAELRSPIFSQAGSGCTMTFWYYNYGLSVGAAEMLLIPNREKKPTVLWRIYYDQGDEWLKGFIQLDRLSEPFQLSFNKINVGFYDGVSAIDDIMFENCSLPPAVERCFGPERFWCKETKACISTLLVCDLTDDCGDGSDEENCNSELQCSLESDLCNWVQDSDDDFDWTRYQGPTPTLDTGPMKDHTYGTAKGHYLYIESSEPQVYQNQAVLLSPEIDAPVNNGNKTCIFRFYYHMLGKQIYSLAVYKRIMRNTRGILLWQAFGNKGNRWLKKTLYIDSNQPFQLMIVGTVGDGFTGDIGIDDLSFLGCSLYRGTLPTWSPAPVETPTVATLPSHNCSANEYVCRSTGQCIPIIKICDFKADCPDNSDEAKCASEYCSFENGSMCQWFQPNSSLRRETVFLWDIGKGSTIHPGEENHRPLRDHTLATEEGSYLYADSSNGEFGHTAHIMTPVISLTGPKCKLAFWTYMNGATVGSLQVLIKFGNVTYEVWSQSGKQGPQWNRAEVFLGTLSYFQIVLRAKRGVSYIGDVTVDDISFENCSPMPTPSKACLADEFMCSNKYCIPKDNLCDYVNDCADNSDEYPFLCNAFLGRCDFEFDFCDWRQNQNDDFDWNFRAGSTPTVGTGPVTDHTLKNPSGYYIFIESSFPHLPTQGAKISGPMISRWSKNCKLLFYFHMFGGGIGTLSVWQMTLSNKEILLLKLTGDQGNFWQKRELTLSSLGEDYYVEFHAKIGINQRGDIALDDIAFTNECFKPPALIAESYNNMPQTELCPPSYLSCNNGKCFRPEQRCNFIDDCGDNTDENDCGTSCTFEEGICGWKNSVADSFDWVLGKHSIQALRPPRDHTIGNEEGHFLFLESSPVGLRGEKAHLKSSKWRESGANCTLVFWYFMSPKATGIIQVLIKTENALSKLWSESEMQDVKWNKVELYLGKLRSFEVIFEGIRTRDFGGGAALDDIEFRNCSILGEEPGKCLTDTDFRCRNKKCIESHLVCDYKPDCEDLSDETNCSEYTSVPGSCNFEYTEDNNPLECGLTQDQDDDFDWSRGDRGMIGLNTDHTPGSGKHFLFINSSLQQEGDIARILTSNDFLVTNGTCRIRFWYYIQGPPDSSTLKLYIVTNHGLNFLYWSAAENTNMRWTYANVILSSNSPYRVAFEAHVGGEQLFDIALDDISFTPDCNMGGPTIPQLECPKDQFTCAYVKECVAIDAKCNGIEDCTDGSDEFSCPTVIPTVTSTQCEKTEMQCADRKCLPAMMWCDGVPDCPMGEDEHNCTSDVCLGSGSLLCLPTNTCIHVSQRCDGKPDCPYFNADESSCKVCPNGYCKNAGVCILENDVPLCRCPKQWKGNRCHLSAIKVPPKTTEDNDSGVWIGMGIGLTCLFAELLIAFLCCFCKRKQKENIGSGFSNPVYGGNITSQKEINDPVCSKVQVSVYPWKTSQEQFNKESDICSFANPLYGKKEDSM